MFGRRYTTLLLVAILFVGSSEPARAQDDPFGGAAIGIGLKKLGDAINEAVERAIGGGLILEVQAGGQVSVAIQQAQAAFDHEKQLTFSQLNGVEQNSINSVASVANDFLTAASADMADIEQRAQAAIHQLPFSKNFPQAWKWSPAYFEKVGTASLRVQLIGDFYDLPTNGFDAVLTLGNKPYKNAEKDSGQVTFLIPMSDLQNAPDRPLENSFEIKIPYKAGLFGTKKYASFIGSTVAVPLKLADIDIAITTATSGIEQQSARGPDDQQESGNDDIKCGGEHADLAVHIVYPESGWRVVPSSATWNVTWSQGNQGVDQDWWLDRNCSSPTTACLCVSTEHHGFGTSGKVRFFIVFTEEHDVVNTSINHNPVSVGWGESRVVTIPFGATWTGTYKRYDGKEFQFAGPYKDDFIWVTQDANLVTIATAPWSNVDLARMKDAVDHAIHIPHP